MEGFFDWNEIASWKSPGSLEPQGLEARRQWLQSSSYHKAAGTHLKMIHAGFPDEESKNQHEQAWPKVLAQLDERMAASD